MKCNNKNKIVLVIMLSAILLVSIYYLNLKSGYFVDEGMTLFLANGNYNGAVTSKSDSNLTNFLNEFVIKDSLGDTISNLFNMLKELTTAGNYSVEGTVEWYDAARNLLQGERTWLSGKELFEQMTASDGERFQYMQVFLNQAMDVHPPFYYMLVHTVFSLFSGTYSDAYLFVVNIVALLMSCVVLWKVLELISDNSCTAMVAVAIYGFSQGFISCAVYFRMYAWFTFFAVLTLYMHLLLENSEYNFSKKMSLCFIGTIVLGFYTHYYYIVYLVPLFVITIIRLIKTKRKIQIIAYVKRCVVSGICSLLIWPLSAYHILFSYRGTEASANLISDGLIHRLVNYYHIIKQAFFYNSNVLFVVFVIGLLCVLIFNKKQKRYVIEIFGVSFFYLLVISQIAPAQSDRYIMCIYPLIATVIAMIIIQSAEAFFRNEKWQRIVCGIVLGGLVALSITAITPNYLYLEQKDLPENFGEERSRMNCLMLSDGDWRGFSEALKFSKFGQVIVLEEQQLSVLQEEKPQSISNDTVVYILGGLEQDNNLKLICEMLDYRSDLAEQISSDVADFNAYLLKAEEP